MAVESPSKLRTICQAGKEADPAWYFVHRRVSIYLTWLLLHTSITPNQVTLLMMLTCAAGAALMVPHSAILNVTGFAVLYLAFLLDKVDGEIARYRRVSSTRGLLLDRLHHLAIEPLVFLAAAWHDWASSGSLGAWNAGWAIIVLGNIVDEHQHLSAYILFKHLRGTNQRPPAGRRVAPAGLAAALRVMRPLKAFRMFIIAVPALALAYAIEAVTRWPAVRIYLYLSVAGLAAFLAFQVHYYFQFKLEAEIGEQAEFLADDAGSSDATPGNRSEPERDVPLRAVIR
jgi:phosphatidylglycerophosphate synthase